MRDNTVLALWQNISLCPFSEVISVHEHGLHSRDTRPGQAVPHFSRLVASTIASDTESWLMIMLMMFFEHLSSLSPLVNRGREVLVLGFWADSSYDQAAGVPKRENVRRRRRPQAPGIKTRPFRWR